MATALLLLSWCPAPPCPETTLLEEDPSTNAAPSPHFSPHWQADTQPKHGDRGSRAL